MNLHDDKETFYDLSALAAEFVGIPEAAARRDYLLC